MLFTLKQLSSKWWCKVVWFSQSFFQALKPTKYITFRWDRGPTLVLIQTYLAQNFFAKTKARERERAAEREVSWDTPSALSPYILSCSRSELHFSVISLMGLQFWFWIKGLAGLHWSVRLKGLIGSVLVGLCRGVEDWGVWWGCVEVWDWKVR